MVLCDREHARDRRPDVVCFPWRGSESVAECFEVPPRTLVLDRADRHCAELGFDEREVLIVGALALVAKARVLTLVLEVVDERYERLRALFAFPATASQYKRMNSGVPGSASMRGPPFQAYQYVLTVPSASFLVKLLMPLSRIRIFRDLPFVIGGQLRFNCRLETG